MDNKRTTSKIQELTYELRVEDVMSKDIETISSKMPVCSLRDV